MGGITCTRRQWQDIQKLPLALLDLTVAKLKLHNSQSRTHKKPTQVYVQAHNELTCITHDNPKSALPPQDTKNLIQFCCLKVSCNQNFRFVTT